MLLTVAMLGRHRLVRSCKELIQWLRFYTGWLYIQSN